MKMAPLRIFSRLIRFGTGDMVGKKQTIEVG
jgi:hypothetical protein